MDRKFGPGFDLHFDKGMFKWVAGSVGEKNAFVMCLSKMVHKQLERKKPEFVNADREKLHELTQVGENGRGEDQKRISARKMRGIVEGGGGSGKRNDRD